MVPAYSNLSTGGPSESRATNTSDPQKLGGLDWFGELKPRFSPPIRARLGGGSLGTRSALRRGKSRRMWAPGLAGPRRAAAESEPWSLRASGPEVGSPLVVRHVGGGGGMFCFFFVKEKKTTNVGIFFSQVKQGGPKFAVLVRWASLSLSK